jgi:hypothetical protein
MTARTCVQCGLSLSEKAKFCAHCGAVSEEAPTAGLTARTLLVLSPGKAPEDPSANMLGKRTILGLPNPPRELAGALPAPSPATMPATPREPAPAAVPTTARDHKTMLGVAMPGIAPLNAGDSPAEPSPSAPPEAPELSPSLLRTEPPPSFGETMPIPAFFVPPPAPLPEAPEPQRLRIQRPRGTPLAAAALLAGVVALVVGMGIALLWRSAPPLAAEPRITPSGQDVLHLTCEPRSCPDGTVVSVGDTKAVFAAGDADLSLSAPLRVGENTLSLSIDRPGRLGRDETVKLVVPVAYRVRADVATMDSSHPCVTVRVEAPPDTEVRIDDRPLSLDASGTGTYVLDEAAVTEGPADESRVVAVEVPYVVVPKGHPAEKGTVSARIAVAPLRVDAPGPSTIVEEDRVLVAGRAAKGANVTVDGAPAAVSPDGSFESTVALGALGERSIEVRAGTSVLAPRTVRVAVTRVESLTASARTFEEGSPIGYDAAMHAIAVAKTGEPIVVEGEVVEARGSGHRTLVLVNDRRGCAAGPCLTRVIVGRDMALGHGDEVRAYGRVARAYRTPSAQTVPEVEAEFVLRSAQ